MDAVELAEVVLWGNVIGAVARDRERGVGSFEYQSDFQRSGVELAPFRMPLGSGVFSFPELSRESFYGLPGLLADSLPDKFGHLLIDEWLARSGRDRASFTPVERLCYLGARGMGALEFRPALRDTRDRSAPIEVASLVALAEMALSQKEQLLTRLGDEVDVEAMQDILRVGTSAGGARAKAVIAWNEATGEVRSGQIQAPEGFGYWLLKFDGLSGNRDRELDDPKGYGKVEYAYSLMARKAGIEMSECRLYHENDRSHFMTRRFDRTGDGGKIFMQSLCALDHMDFNQAGAYGYEQAMLIAQRLELDADALRQLFRRMVFNVLGRNQDDHTKNIGFLMDRAGRWKLSPAYDVTYSYNPRGAWTNQHQMSINGKRDHFARADFLAVARRFRMSRIAGEILEETDQAMARWPDFAEEAGVPESWTQEIASHQRRLKDLK